MDAAVSEQEFVDSLGAAGWDVEWVSVVVEDAGYQSPDQTEAATWASTYGLDPASVLFDAAQDWYLPAVTVGVPTVYAVHTTNMLIWGRVDGWYDPGDPYSGWDGFLALWPDFLDYCEGQPGS